MRKNVIALILLLPLLFLLAVFSSVKTVSLGVPVSAGGVEILNRPEDDVYRIDLSTYADEYEIKARVTPEQAKNRDYILKAEGGAVTIDEKGVIHAVKPGEARIFAVSKDGGYEDSVRAIVYSSSPYDFDFSLSSLWGSDAVSFQPTEEGLEAEILTGRYIYSGKSYPKGFFSLVKIETEQGEAEIDRPSAQILFPFAGETVLKLSLEGKRGGKEALIEKKVRLRLQTPRTSSGLVINGGNPALVLERDAAEAEFYVAGEEFEIEPHESVSSASIEKLSDGKYKVKVTFSRQRDFELTLKSAYGSEPVSFRFADFDFSVRSDLPVQGGESVIVEGETTFYAVPSVSAKGVSYRWSAPDFVRLVQSEDGSECKVKPERTGEFDLTVQALKNGAPLDLFEKKIKLRAVRQVSAAQFLLNTQLGLSKTLVLAGERMEGDSWVPAEHELPLLLYNNKGERTEGEMELFSSDESIARIENGKLVPVGSGKVTLTASWKGNQSFGTDVKAEAEVYVLKDGAEVSASRQLYRAAAEGKKIVLCRDIALGTDETGAPLSVSERRNLLGEMKSTYNTAYYENRGEKALVKYALELKNDVYGNGFSINAEYLSSEQDGSGQPLFFRGPLDFVRFGQVASVAAQDNICFLIRTDGVKLYNLTLLGCSDDRLSKEQGYDLSALDLTGTVLEVNADMSLINCRIRNGRTCMRVYGGNRTGNAYFSDGLGELNGRADRERIKVEIEGSILSQSREFILKIGANGALRSTPEAAEPDLVAMDGSALVPQTNDYAEDPEFYQRYVFTDVTLRDSVLETSGFFTIGVESNFSGDLLQTGGSAGGLEFEGWRGAGGTSFASILRLEGDVLLYDWKELNLIDSSTLIKTELPELKLDIAAMLSFVTKNDPQRYGNLLDEGYVHGGIAFYGGGKNYSQLIDRNLNASEDLDEYRVNISVLSGAEGNTGYLGQILPSAAGTQDFRFYLYGKDGKNSLAAHRALEAEGRKYEKIHPISP